MREKKESSFFSTMEKVIQDVFIPGDYDRFSSTGGSKGYRGIWRGSGGFQIRGIGESVYRTRKDLLRRTRIKDVHILSSKE